MDGDCAPARWRGQGACATGRLSVEQGLHPFIAALTMVGSIAFVQKKYADSERWYGDVVARFANFHFAPEAMYCLAVRTTSRPTITQCLARVAEGLRSTYPASVGASKVSPWLHQEPKEAKMQLS